MVRKFFVFAAVGSVVSILGLYAAGVATALWAFVIVGPLVLLGVHDITQTRHSLLRVFPILGHGRYLMEVLRPEIQQYFVESDTNGMPFNREKRSVIYQRAKGVRDTVPFGTQRDLNNVGVEWIAHSLKPNTHTRGESRVLVGADTCSRAYEASHLNISAMSYGSLSKNSIRALNMGAKIGGFAHNTGEGSISPYHLEAGGDLIWQIGTGYFGCRDKSGNFDEGAFQDRAQHDSVRMIEVKLSQGAKPGHGGILPAAKVSTEIAQIRGVPIGKDVISPPAHSAFSSPAEMLGFLARLREVSGGKPVGFKLCVGLKHEVLQIVRAMAEHDLVPDFVTVDGAEGGTGAAPLELANSVGMPLRDGLVFMDNALRGYGIRDRIRVVAAGKVSTGFDMFRMLALGADTCNAARAMMFALGCIQARKCNDNSCPVGVATTDPWHTPGVVPKDKGPRVAAFHKATVASLMELVGVAGLKSTEDVSREHVMRRCGLHDVRSYAEIYERIPEGSLAQADGVPESWRTDVARAGRAA